MQQNAEPSFPAGSQESSFDSKCLLLVVGCAKQIQAALKPRGTSRENSKPFLCAFLAILCACSGCCSPSCPATPHKHPQTQQGTCWFPSARAETPQSQSSPLPGQNSCAAPEVSVMNQEKRGRTLREEPQQTLV